MASYALASFEKCVILEPTKKSPSSLSLLPNPNQGSYTHIIRSRNPSASSSSTFLRKTRRQSTPSPSSPADCSVPISHTPLSSNPVLLRAEPESPISLHEWQRSISDRIKSPFPSEVYQPSPSSPQPKVSYGTVSTYSSAPPQTTNSNRNTMTSSTSHKSLSQSVTSNLSAALSSAISPSSRRKSRTLSPLEMKRFGDADQSSTMSGDSPTPPVTTALQQGCFDDEIPSSLPNAEKVLEQAMRHHQLRKHQQRYGGQASVKSMASTGSGKDSLSSSPVQISPAIRPISTLPPMRLTTSIPPNLSIASFEVLIKELEEEEEARKRQPQIPQLPPSPSKSGPQDLVSSPGPADLPVIAQSKGRRPTDLNDAKRRSTGSILLDKENSFPFPLERKSRESTQSHRVSVASFCSQQSESKRNSAHEVTFNFVDWNGVGGGLSVSDRRASRELSSMMVRSSSSVASVFEEFDESERLSSYNYGRRRSVF